MGYVPVAQFGNPPSTLTEVVGSFKGGGVRSSEAGERALLF